MIRNFKTLEIWKRSKNLVVRVYDLTSKIPKSEQRVLIYQLHKSAISVPSNIAEGCGRNSYKELTYFINIASGSICELETQLYIGLELNYLSAEEVMEAVKEITQIRKMLISYRNSILNQYKPPDP